MHGRTKKKSRLATEISTAEGTAERIAESQASAALKEVTRVTRLRQQAFHWL